MSPDQIALVRATWALALRDVDVLTTSVAEGLTATPEENAERARWAVGSITRLVVTLDRPTVFGRAARTELAQLPPFTLDGLGVVQRSVLDALRRLGGELPPAEERAWGLAFALFQELVAEHHLDPFHPSPTPTSSPTPTTAGPAGPTQETRS